MPSLGIDLFYGINANQFAARTNYPTQATGRSTLPNFEVPYRQNLGYVAQATLNIPVWNWGTTRSKVKQAELKRDQAQLDLTLAQRTSTEQLAPGYMPEARIAQAQLESLRISATNWLLRILQLTLLRYQAGEATALEVVDAQTTVTQARNAHDDGLARYRVAIVNVQILAGTLRQRWRTYSSFGADSRPRSLLAVVALLNGCGKAKSTETAGEGQEAPTPVTVETAVRGAIDRMVIADAILYPVNQANVTPKISAPVKRMLVNRGDHVRAGQPLAELESADLAASAEESRQQYEQSQAAYQTLTGATVLDDRTKAQADESAARQASTPLKTLREPGGAGEGRGARSEVG